MPITAAQLIAIYKLGKVSLPISKSLYDEIKHGGKEKIGSSFYLKDEKGREWKVKVRRTGKRDEYVKFKHVDDSGDKLKFKAGVTSHSRKPDKYRKISNDEWSVLAIMAECDYNKSSDLLEVCESILNRLCRG